MRHSPILVDVIPGQETGNADYVVSGSAGVLTNDTTEVLEAMAHWLDKDRNLYQQQAQNARQLGNPQAAMAISELAWDFASCREQPLGKA